MLNHWLQRPYKDYEIGTDMCEPHKMCYLNINGYARPIKLHVTSSGDSVIYLVAISNNLLNI